MTHRLQLIVSPRVTLVRIPRVHVCLHYLPLVVVLGACKYQGYVLVRACVYVCVHVRLHYLPLVVVLWTYKYQGYVLVCACVYVCVHVHLHDLPLVVVLWACKYQGYVLVCVCMYACMYVLTISLWWSFCGPVSIKGMC